MNWARCEKSTTSNCWSDRALGYAHMPVSVREVWGCKTTSHTPCNAASPDVYGACPSPKRPDTFWAFFSPFLPFAHRLPGIFCVAIIPGRAYVRPGLLLLAIAAEAGPRHLTGRARSDSCRPRIRQMCSGRCAPGPLQSLRRRLAVWRKHIRASAPLSRCLLPRRCL